MESIMKFEVIAKHRGAQGTGASRRLRRTGLVPAIVYGAGQEASAIELLHKDFLRQLKNEAFHASILTLDIDGAKEPVLLRDIQMHPFKPQVLHVDFQRVDKDQKIHVKVPLHFVNAENAPGVKLEGGTVSHIITELDVSCLPDRLPEYIEVDLSSLHVGHSVHLADLKLPEGVETMSLQRGENLVVAAVNAPKGGAAEEEVAAAPAAAAAAPPAA
jgi:large subunit ribosomal protein L25